MNMVPFFFIFVLLVRTANANKAYLPGVVARGYSNDEQIKMYVTGLSSTKTQIPFDYYSLPYCKPKKAKMKSENLGEVLSGDRIEDSIYQMNTKETKHCVIACVKSLSKKERRSFVRAIDEDYKVHWLLDNLPSGMITSGENRNEETFSRGFPVGFHTGHGSRAKHYLNNHVRIFISYHDVDTESGKTTLIVGFRVEPYSVDHTWEGSTVNVNSVLSTCNDRVHPRGASADYLSLDNDVDKIVFTYDVVWEMSDIEWHNRWDVYLSANSSGEKIHWFSISNFVMIVFFLTTMIAMIFLRSVRKEIAQYNDIESIEEANEGSGWKLVHGDVFRPPSTYPMLLSVFVGTGTQLMGMVLSTLSFAVLGLLSPANRGSLVTCLILLFVFMGAFAGYSSSVVYKMFRGTQWQRNTFMTALLFPGGLSLALVSLNTILFFKGSSGALPFSTLFTLLFLWLCVSVPLVFLGSFFGYKRETVEFPVRTNQIPRAIPEQAWYLNGPTFWAVGGILPFGAVSVELYFIMSALWLHHIYYIFGFLFLVFLVLIITCAEVSILLCYFQLCAEDYRWWWNSFLTAGACGGYILLYGVWYNLMVLEIEELVPLIVYSSYMCLFSFTIFLVTGTIGFIATIWFNMIIYSSIKVD